MKDRSVVHSTFVIERSYPVAPGRVFAAFADPVKKRRWFAEGEKAVVEEFVMDFRVGGRERSSFRFGDTVCRNDSAYMDIVPDRRIVIAYTMTLGERCISSSQMTVEFAPKGDGTALIFTEQGAYFEGADGPVIREEGWNKLFDELAKELAG